MSDNESMDLLSAGSNRSDRSDGPGGSDTISYGGEYEPTSDIFDAAIYESLDRRIGDASESIKELYTEFFKFWPILRKARIDIEHLKDKIEVLEAQLQDKQGCCNCNVQQQQGPTGVEGSTEITERRMDDSEGDEPGARAPTARSVAYKWRDFINSRRN